MKDYAFTPPRAPQAAPRWPWWRPALWGAVAVVLGALVLHLAA